MVRGASAAVASPQSWHRFRYPVSPESCTVLSNGDSSNEEQWAGTLDSLTAMNTEITVMEKILRALMEANREEESPSLMVPDKKSEPLLS